MHFADVCCLQESKLEEISAATWREIGGHRLDKFCFVPARGSAGGIIVGWNSASFTCSILTRGTFCLTVEFYSKLVNVTWRCTTVYGPNARALKREFWEELRANVGPQDKPWIICGDFNATFKVEDKNGGIPNLEDIRMANLFLHDLKLQEPPAVGRRFSWTNGQSEAIWVKLDRFIVNEDCASRFPKMIQNSLPRLGSDHVPIRLEVRYHCSMPRPFRYEIAWATAEGFGDLVKKWWEDCSLQGCGAFVMAKKLMYLRGQLRTWAKFSFGSIKLKKLALLHELDLLDVAKENGVLSAEESNHEVATRSELDQICKQEEIYWRQRSRLQWLKEGDDNTSYFHAVANGRKNRNCIPCIAHNGVTITDPKEIGKAFCERFHQQFGLKRSTRSLIDFRKLLLNRNAMDLSQLERPFTIEEVKAAVLDLGKDKAPGPDGFPLQFF
ncbi:uncharacterized protein LOC120263623 [Dioscorea cayenensis subsp. rotundata]|uniref:Uncharacterized protein LOC120263623 n=1 Tax=Dioscorea cayennensis subsp. rotundata TaxID=55577 RepID=A0AB40BJG6_DIOCR|nr:uncharacterized protein LOC120263623 [Dioscorea cayenensis subsp. rotundata]